VAASELIVQKYGPEKGANTRAADDLLDELGGGSPAGGPLSRESLAAKIGRLRTGDPDGYWARPRQRKLLEAFASLLGSTPEALLGDSGPRPGELDFPEFPGLPPLRQGEYACPLGVRGWLLDEVLLALTKSSEQAIQWFAIPAGWGKSLVVRTINERLAERVDAVSVETTTCIRSYMRRGRPLVVELETSTLEDRAEVLRLGTTMHPTVVLAPFQSPLGAGVSLGDELRTCPAQWRPRLVNWVEQRLLRATNEDTRLYGQEVLSWLAEHDPQGTLVSCPGDLLALCADFHFRGGAAPLKKRAAAWLNQVAPKGIPDDAPATWRKRRIPRLFRSACKARLVDTGAPLDEYPDADSWEAIIPAKDHLSERGDGLLAGYMQAGGLLRGRNGGLELFPNWVREAIQREEITQMLLDADGIDAWGAIASDRTRQSIVDSALAGLSDPKFAAVLHNVIVAAGTTDSLPVIAAVEALFSALGPRLPVSGNGLSKANAAEIQKLVELQFRWARRASEYPGGIERRFPVTRAEDHRRFVTDAWTISLACVCDEGFDARDCWRYLPDWSDEFDLAKIPRGFFPAWAAEEPTSRRFATLLRKLLEPGGDAPAIDQRVGLVAPYVYWAGEHGWPLTRDHMGRLHGRWENALLAEWLASANKAVKASGLRAMWATSSAVAHDHGLGRSLAGQAALWATRFPELGPLVLLEVNGEMAAAGVRAHGLFDDDLRDGTAGYLRALPAATLQAALREWVGLDLDLHVQVEDAEAVATLLDPDDAELGLALIRALPYNRAQMTLARRIWVSDPQRAFSVAVAAVRAGLDSGQVWFSEAPRTRLPALLDAVEGAEPMPPWVGRQLERCLKHGGDIGTRAYSLLTRRPN